MQDVFAPAKEEMNNSENTPKEVIELFPPNNTVYIRNINEKIPLDGKLNIEWMEPKFFILRPKTRAF